jgi:hypothetical protein
MFPDAGAVARNPRATSTDRAAIAELGTQLAGAHAQIQALSAQLRQRPTSVTRLRTRLRDEVIRLVNETVLDLHAGNILLAAMGIAPVKGGADVTVRVPTAITVRDDGPAATIRNALAVVRRDLGQARWTTFAGCPDGYGIDEPGPPRRPHRVRRAVVHADLRLRVTVAAYPGHALWQTALRLLRQDLRRLHRLRASVQAVTEWDDDHQLDEDGSDADQHDFDDPEPDDFDDPDGRVEDLDPATHLDSGAGDFTVYDLVDYDPDEADHTGHPPDGFWDHTPKASETYF